MGEALFSPASDPHLVGEAPHRPATRLRGRVQCGRFIAHLAGEPAFDSANDAGVSADKTAPSYRARLRALHARSEQTDGSLDDLSDQWVDALNAWARVRLSAKPRSTSNSSARRPRAGVNRSGAHRLRGLARTAQGQQGRGNDVRGAQPGLLVLKFGLVLVEEDVGQRHRTHLDAGFQ